MTRHLFISQQTITKWMDQEKIDFDGDVMTVKSDGRRFTLLEAVRIIRVEGEDEDKAGLLGKVKTDSQLEAMGAERYRDSVICQDVAYKAQEGFIGEVFVRKAEEEGESPEPESAREPVATEEKTPVPTHEDKPPEPVLLKPKALGTSPVVQPPASDLARTQPMEAMKEPASAGDLGAAVRQASGEKEPEKDGELTDEELLTNFLLENL